MELGTLGERRKSQTSTWDSDQSYSHSCIWVEKHALPGMLVVTMDILPDCALLSVVITASEGTVKTLSDTTPSIQLLGPGMIIPVDRHLTPPENGNMRKTLDLRIQG
ncbi:uncharacterized protein LOC143679526 [Tamandua tetradactyla]|uniref:uncharacterized protein LOC143679526 n=1 Tax=Tamandua tetradactyla TaxID=48850 RepID=UPI00405425B9